MVNEVWKDVRGYEGCYAVSNLGRVWNYRENREQCQAENSAGYYRVCFRRKKFFVHRLVAEVFVEGIFDGAIVNHKDCDKTNNTADNLEWVTRKYNSKHAYDNGHQPGSFKNKPYTLTFPSGEKFTFASLADCARAIDVSRSNMYNFLDKPSEHFKRFGCTFEAE